MVERPYGIELYENQDFALGDPRWQVRNGVLDYIEQLEAENKQLARYKRSVDERDILLTRYRHIIDVLTAENRDLKQTIANLQGEK